MSRLVRCNRCGAEGEIFGKEKTNNPVEGVLATLSRVSQLKGWRALEVKPWTSGLGMTPPSLVFDLCEDCQEILVEQFLKGAAVAPITQPLVQTILPHQPMTDCMLVWDPERGGFLCEHDDSERYHKLCRDQAQNCAEGVPPRDVQDAVSQMVEDVATAGYAHAHPRRCTPTCSEAHTYQPGCLLANEKAPDEPGGDDYYDAGIPGQRLPQVGEDGHE